MSPGNAYKGVTRWYSPSNSYIQIDSFKQPVACGKDFQLDILYSTPSDTNYNFYVMVSFQISNLLFLEQKTEELISILTISALIFTDKNTEIILLIIISTC